MNFKRTEIVSLIVHKVGNKSREEGVTLSRDIYNIEDDTLEALLLTYFLKQFKYDDFYKFVHPSNLKYNEIYSYVSDIFLDNEKLPEKSVDIADHLYNQSMHPKINGGELVIAILENCFIEGEYVDAIGIFKSENKETYIKFNEGQKGLLMNYEKGINVRKLDKGAIIFNHSKEQGYRVLSIDNNSQDAQYWFKNFLNIEIVKNNRYKTNTALDLCEGFVKEVVSDVLDKKDQMVMLNKSYDYIEDSDNFNIDEFAEEIIGEEEYIKQFRDYTKDYEDKMGVKVEKSFPVAKSAVVQAKKRLKNFIKLDTNIQIKINLDNPEVVEEYVERAYDYEKDMHYYKIYFNEELD